MGKKHTEPILKDILFVTFLTFCLKIYVFRVSVGGGDLVVMFSNHVTRMQNHCSLYVRTPNDLWNDQNQSIKIGPEDILILTFLTYYSHLSNIDIFVKNRMSSGPILIL